MALTRQRAAGARHHLIARINYQIGNLKSTANAAQHPLNTSAFIASDLDFTRSVLDTSRARRVLTLTARAASRHLI
jgi:hypothetical protein